MRWVECPLFAVSCFQGTLDQPQEAVVLDVFTKDVCQDGVIDIIEGSNTFIPLSTTHW